MSKEVWIDLYDELKDLALSRGMSEKDAEIYAQENIDARYADTIKEAVDHSKDIRKYGLQ